jgi:antitoxin YefM
MTTLSASEARRTLFPLIKRVTDDRVPVEITSAHGNVVLMAAEDFEAWQETAYLLASPANAQRLRRAYADAKLGHRQEHPLDLT